MINIGYFKDNIREKLQLFCFIESLTFPLNQQQDVKNKEKEVV